jgi:TonB-dependent SusC/RagA subfamily outer membrane receptor
MIGDNTPLYVVDGFPVTGGIDFLNPSDIESIDILKDASAKAIYGSRGANGVVIITSKRGKARQRSSISVEGFYGVQKVAKTFDLLDARQYATVANEFLKNDGLAPFFNVDTISGKGTDWQDVIFRDAPVHNHTLTFSGSSDKTNYSASGNYYSQEGIIINSSAQRGSFRLNLDHEIKSWLTFAGNIAISRREQLSAPVDNGERGSTLFSGALSAPPTLSPYDANGQYNRIEQIYPFTDPTDIRNPLIWSSPRKDRRLYNSLLINTALDFNPHCS